MGKQTRGFTLIELLVVIAIIGILSSVVLASLNGARKKGRDARRVSDLKQIQLALELYYDANSSYPATSGTDLPAALVTAGTISSLPEDPINDTTYFYQYDDLGASNAACTANPPTTKCSNYVLGANMEITVPSGDINGTVGGVNCANGTEGSAQNKYCLQP